MKKVIAYIDGFNLYYRSLKKTKWKWLDLEILVENLMPGCEILKIRYFTAIVKNRESELRQNAYLKALETKHKIEVHKGLFKKNPKSNKFKKLIKSFIKNFIKDYRIINNYFENDFIEKRSDVGLGAYMVYDAFTSDCDCFLLISNDLDFYDPIEIIKSKLNKDVIVVNPDKKQGFPNDFLELRNKYGISLRRIREQNLKQSQLPNPVILKNSKEIKKPIFWQF